MLVERIKKILKKRIEEFEKSFDFSNIVESDEVYYKIPLKVITNVDFGSEELNLKYEEIIEDFEDWEMFILELVSPELRDKWQIVLDKARVLES